MSKRARESDDDSSVYSSDDSYDDDTVAGEAEADLLLRALYVIACIENEALRKHALQTFQYGVEGNVYGSKALVRVVAQLGKFKLHSDEWEVAPVVGTAREAVDAGLRAAELFTNYYGNWQHLALMWEPLMRCIEDAADVTPDVCDLAPLSETLRTLEFVINSSWRTGPGDDKGKISADHQHYPFPFVHSQLVADAQSDKRGTQAAIVAARERLYVACTEDGFWST